MNTQHKIINGRTKKELTKLKLVSENSHPEPKLKLKKKEEESRYGCL